MSVQRVGYVFEDELRRGLELSSPWFFKIPDTKMLGFVNHILKQQNMNQITFPRVPADFIAHGKDGATLYIEAKATHKVRGFPIDNLKEHQVIEGYTLDNIGYMTKYRFFIYFKSCKRAFSVTPEFILAYIRAKINTIPFEEIESHGEEIFRFTGKHHPYNEGAFFDLKKFFN